MSRYSACALACAALGCATTQIAPAPSVGVTAPSSAFAAPARELAEPPLPRLSLPGQPACRLENRVLYAQGEAPLRLCVDDGACYLELTGGPVQMPFALDFAVGARPRALLEAREAGFVFRGFIDSSRVQLFTNEPTVLSGFVIPNLVTVAAAEPGKLRVAVPTDASLKPLSPIETALPCSALTTYCAWVEHEERLARAGITTPGVTREVLRPELPLSITPGGDAVATLAMDGKMVDAHEVKGRLTRIVLVSDDGAIVFGWVPSSALGKASAGVGFGASGGGDAWVVGAEPGLAHACPRDVPLFAELGARRFEVGKLLARTRFRVAGRADRAFDVVEPAARLARRDGNGATKRIEHVRLTPGATLLMRHADAATCGAP